MGGLPAEADVLREILERAGQEALTRFHRGRFELKPDGTEVTAADRAAEARIVEGLSAAFPGTGIRGEEGVHIDGHAGTWHVDPLDGTAAYLEGLAHWGPTLCLVEGGRIRLGAFWTPLTREFWFVAAGHGAWRDGVRLAVEPRATLTRNDTVFVPSRIHRMPAVHWPGKVRALGSSAAHLAHTASGGGVACIMGRWHLWDVGCGALMVEEAGGAIVGLDGVDIHPSTDNGPPFVAGDRLAVDALLKLLREIRPFDGPPRDGGRR